MTQSDTDALIRKLLVADPAVCGGQVCVKGTRIPASLILGAMAGGDTIDDLLRGYPKLTRESIAAVLAYGSRLATERILPVVETS
jgi:uncharacterized protein (DUF433 family)